MSFLFWLAALFLFCVWSVVGWLLFAGSGWIASLLAATLDGVMPAEFAPWAQWLSGGLGQVVQVAIGLTWAIVGLAILSAPVWVGRLRSRRDNFLPAGPAPSYQTAWRDTTLRGGDWKKREAWKGQFERGRHELGELKQIASGMVEKYRKTKKKKKKRDDDD